MKLKNRKVNKSIRDQSFVATGDAYSKNGAINRSANANKWGQQGSVYNNSRIVNAVRNLNNDIDHMNKQHGGVNPHVGERPGSKTAVWGDPKKQKRKK